MKIQSENGFFPYFYFTFRRGEIQASRLLLLFQGKECTSAKQKYIGRSGVSMPVMWIGMGTYSRRLSSASEGKVVDRVVSGISG